MLDSRKKYLQIAFNSPLEEVREMILKIPDFSNILIEAGTPLIKTYGVKAISHLKAWTNAHIVADLKCMDRGSTEVEAVALAGASSATCLGLAPIETIKEFIRKCRENNLDSMIDMMSVEFPFEVLQKLAPDLPNVVVLHRGVDENERNKEKQLPLNQIHRVRGSYNNLLISVAGGEKPREVQSAFFNDANIVVVWKEFYQNPEKTNELFNQFRELTH